MKSIWRPMVQLSHKEKYDINLIVAAPELVDGDFNPHGVSQGFYQDDEGWIGLKWDGCNDEPYREKCNPTHFAIIEGPIPTEWTKNDPIYQETVELPEPAVVINWQDFRHELVWGSTWTYKGTTYILNKLDEQTLTQCEDRWGPTVNYKLHEIEGNVSNLAFNREVVDFLSKFKRET